MNLNRGDLHWALFPYDDKNIEKERPIVILDTEPLRALVVKVTSHDPRDMDDRDIPIIFWKEAGLDESSVARCSKSILLDRSKIYSYIGTLNPDDLINILDGFYSKYDPNTEQ